MFWVLLTAACAYCIVNLPLVYSLLRVHGWKGIGWLWGYAPNQFFFLVVVFPFATLYTFLALRILVVDVRVAMPMSDPARFVLLNWSAWLVAGLGFVSLITVVVYFASAMSLDKLRPAYVAVARDAIAKFDRRLARVPEGEREARRADIIRGAQAEAASDQPPVGDDERAVGDWLRAQEPEVALQFLMNPGSQLRLQLLNPTIHALNIFQLLVGLFVGVIALASAFLTIYSARITNFPNVPSAALSEAVRFLNYALFFFAIYPLLYHELRLQMQEFVGRGFNVMQDILSAGIVLFVMVVLSYLQPTERLISLESVAKYLPLVVLTGGAAAGGLAPGIWRQLVGRETSWGIQVLVALLFMVMASLPLLQELLRRRIV
jgi:hypothetical protein